MIQSGAEMGTAKHSGDGVASRGEQQYCQSLYTKETEISLGALLAI